MAIHLGTRFGVYEIVAPIGVGGMGEVYRARDRQLNREVAVMLLHGHVAADPERLDRFSREAHLLAALSHPNIAHVYGFEAAPVEGDSGALIMELVEGETLAERLSAGPLPLGADRHARDCIAGTAPRAIAATIYTASLAVSTLRAQRRRPFRGRR